MLNWNFLVFFVTSGGGSRRKGFTIVLSEDNRAQMSTKSLVHEIAPPTMTKSVSLEDFFSIGFGHFFLNFGPFCLGGGGGVNQFLRTQTFH